MRWAYNVTLLHMCSPGEASVESCYKHHALKLTCVTNICYASVHFRGGPLQRHSSGGHPLQRANRQHMPDYVNDDSAGPAVTNCFAQHFLQLYATELSNQ